MNHNWNNRLLNLHLQNLNHLLNTFDDTTHIIEQHLLNSYPQQQSLRRNINNINNSFSNNRQSNRTFSNPFNVRNNNNLHDNNNMNNNLNTTNNNNSSINNDDLTYVLRFDTLFPPTIPSITRRTTTMNNGTNHHTIGYLNESTSEDISSLLQIFDLLDVEKYELIQNPINDVCPITRDRFYPTQNVMMISSCKHIFNKSSLNIWLSNHNNCPYCRSPILNDNEQTNNTSNDNNDISDNNAADIDVNISNNESSV